MCTPAGLTIGSETWPTGNAAILSRRSGHDRVQARTQPRSPPFCALAAAETWRARAAKLAPPRSVATRPACIVEHGRLLGAIVDRQQDLAQLSSSRSQAGRGATLEREVDLVLGHHDVRTDLAADDLDPGDLGAQLLAQRARIEAAVGEERGQSSATLVWLRCAIVIIAWSSSASVR